MFYFSLQTNKSSTKWVLNILLHLDFFKHASYLYASYTPILTMPDGKHNCPCLFQCQRCQETFVWIIFTLNHLTVVIWNRTMIWHLRSIVLFVSCFFNNVALLLEEENYFLLHHLHVYFKLYIEKMKDVYVWVFHDYREVDKIGCNGRQKLDVSRIQIVIIYLAYWKLIHGSV